MLLLLCAALVLSVVDPCSGYFFGDTVRGSKRTQYQGQRTVWSDLLVTVCPRCVSFHSTATESVSEPLRMRIRPLRLHRFGLDQVVEMQGLKTALDQACPCSYPAASAHARIRRTSVLDQTRPCLSVARLRLTWFVTGCAD